jgi:hypothetical protein
MAKKQTWEKLPHQEKIRKLKSLTDDEIVESYAPTGTTESEMRKQLARERELWRPENIGEAKTAGGPPKKETFLGAMRDLNRAEALLELIDNSIDAWMKRRARYKNKTAAQLQIYIDLATSGEILTYEDNAGGVEEDNLTNLVVPGFSETNDSDRTIGSYRTGGKKAIFKLASDANIRTRYWNPVGTTDDAFEVHLERSWLEDSQLYTFPYFPLKKKTILQKGQTIYTFLLRDPDWDQNLIDRILEEIRRTYTLLLVRNPEIEIYFNDRTKPLQPIQDLYRFSGAKDTGIDIRPQKVIFKSSVEWLDKTHDIEIEIVWGCRTTTAAKRDGDIWGVDLYGNNRLFVHHDQDQVLRWFSFPPGQARQYIRGFINIIGPNVLVPWDTHKRHLNEDSPVVRMLRKKPFTDLFAAWDQVYDAVSNSENVRAKIKQVFEPWKAGKDINVASSDEVTVSSTRRRNTVKMHQPKVPTKKKTATPNLEIRFSVTKPEFRDLCGKFKLDPDRTAKKQLSEAIRQAILRQKTLA